MKYNIEILRLISVILITFTHTKHNLENGVLYYIIEELPKFGTLTLSIISGYLYWTASKSNKSIFIKKVKTLAVPYLIVNGIVILMTVLAYYLFNYNFLNRLSFDYHIITEGLFALNSPPINPPTYFIRDLFIVFTIIELIRYRNPYMLLIIIPYTVFGQLMLRYDILILFLTGVLFACTEDFIKKNYLFIILTGIIICSGAVFFTDIHIYKYPIAVLIFILFMNLNVRFFNAGGFAYLLFLYHSPVIILTFPLLKIFSAQPCLNVIFQITTAISVCIVIYLLTRKYKKLTILSGGR